MKELTIKAAIENLPAVTAFLDEILEAADCSMKAQMQLDVAMDELFGNIARYAYAPGEGDATVRVSVDADARVAEVTLIDSGIPFNPLEASQPDTAASAEDRPIGGLGIFLVRKTMDDVSYVRDGDRNVLTLRKKI